MPTSLPTYTGDVTALVQPTNNAVTNALIGGSKWGTGPAGTGATLTFSFPASVAAFDVQANVAGNYNAQEPFQAGFAKYLEGFAVMPADAQQATRAVLAAWAAVTNLTFTEVPANTVEAGALRFAYTSPPGIGATTYGSSWFPQDLAGAGDTWMNARLLFPEGWAKGTQNFLTMLHEAGHAIGLKHPHDTGLSGVIEGWPVNPAVLPKTGTDTLDAYSTQNMVMAYNDIPGRGSPLQADFAPTTPMQVDIAAIQYLYGANMAHNAGDTVYTFSSGARYNETLWDGGGRDTIRVDGNAAAAINLTPGSWSQLGLPLTFSNRKDDLSIDAPLPALNDPFTVYIYDTVTIENAIGGGGNDIVVGNAVANRLQGGGGNDGMDGGAGIDSAVFGGARAAYTVTKGSERWTVAGGDDGTDTLLNIERLVFADKGLALDTAVDGRAGQTAQILRALFGPSSLDNGTFVGIGISLLDQGVSYNDLVALAIGTTVFEQLAGSRSNTDFVKLVYKNVTGVEAGAADLANFVGLLDAGTFTQASLGVLACQVAFNVGSVELVGLFNSGLEFIAQDG